MAHTHRIAGYIDAAGRLMTATAEFLAAGCPLVDAAAHLSRSVECSLCVLPPAPETDPATAPLRPGWDAHSGRCQVCGCYALKLRLATETCPLGRWPSA